jgi:hypothetical protein
MELFVDLPQTLFNSYNKPIQLHIYHRLAFLWKTSYEVMKDSPILSHQLSLNFYTLASQSDVELPGCRHISKTRFHSDSSYILCSYLHDRSY